jgi:Zn finger protein HypA/HybF involved in hydrogenase expression
MQTSGMIHSLLANVVATARREGASEVTHVRVQLGPLAELTPAQLAEHFEQLARGSLAESAILECETCDPQQPSPQNVRLVSIDVC